MKLLSVTFVSLLLLSACSHEPNTDNIVLRAGRGDLLSFLSPPVYAVTVNGSGETPVGLPSGLGDEPEWSPDGKWVTYVDKPAFPNGDILYLMRSDGNRRVRIESSLPGGRHPTWSPDGKQIAFLAFDGRRAGIYTLNVECILREQECQLHPIFLTEGDNPDWSPDGKRIVYELPSKSHIYVTNADGSGEPMDLTPNRAYCSHPQWSPDGTRIAFDCSRTIVLMNADGSGMVNLVHDAQIPKWSPDGTKIAFISTRDGLGQDLNGEGTALSEAIFLLDIDSGSTVRLTKRNDETILWYTWLPPLRGQ